MSVRRYLVVSAALIALLGLSACGDDGDGGSADDPVDTSTPAETEEPTTDDGGEPAVTDACGLITADEVVAVLQTARPDDSGFAVTPEGTVEGEGSRCVYSWTSDFAEGAFDVSVFPESLFFDSGIEKTPLPGIGDEAFEQSDNYYAVVGDWMVHIVNVQLTEQAPVDLLEIAAERLAG